MTKRPSLFSRLLRRGRGAKQQTRSSARHGKDAETGKRTDKPDELDDGSIEHIYTFW